MRYDGIVGNIIEPVLYLVYFMMMMMMIVRREREERRNGVFPFVVC